MLLVTGFRVPGSGFWFWFSVLSHSSRLQVPSTKHQAPSTRHPAPCLYTAICTEPSVYRYNNTSNKLRQVGNQIDESTCEFFRDTVAFHRGSADDFLSSGCESSGLFINKQEPVLICQKKSC